MVKEGLNDDEIVEAVTEAISRPPRLGEIARALSKHRAQGGNGENPSIPALPRTPKVKFEPELLRRIASKLPRFTERALASRSLLPIKKQTPATFLSSLYRAEETALVLDRFTGWGQPFPVGNLDPDSLDHYREGSHAGVWFLTNPVNGKWMRNANNRLSRRSEGNVTAWRYLLLESDAADPAEWLRFLALVPLRIAAICTSGGKSIHALVRLDCQDKAQFDREVAELKPQFVRCGADPAAMTAVRLSRLPGCERGETGQVQRLLYLNPEPANTPICELKAVR
ncbi:MAG TPA: hypothetical protein VGM54_13680 [Chthoniobacter sp.]